MIIRTPRHWLPRSIDILLTLAAWGGFAYLLFDGVRQVAVSDLQEARVQIAALLPGAQFFATLGSLLFYLALALLFCAVLLGWAKYNQIRAARYQRRQRVPDICHATLAASFGVQPCVLAQLQQEQVLIAHHDEHGELCAVDLPARSMRLQARLPLAEQADGEALPDWQFVPLASRKGRHAPATPVLD